MPSTEDLRGALADHATEVAPRPPSDWSASARRRAVGIRRRRRVGAAAVAAAAVAVVAGVTVVPWPTTPTGPVPVAGSTPPAAMTSLGATYAWQESVEGDDGLVTYDLPRGSAPVLLSWATSGPDDRVTIRGVPSGDLTFDTGDFAEFVVVPDVGTDLQIRVRAQDRDATVGLAAYALRDPAPGVTRGAVTFPERYEGDDLIDAAIGAPGAEEVSLDFDVPAGRKVAFVTSCRGGEQGTLRLFFDDDRYEFPPDACSGEQPTRQLTVPIAAGSQEATLRYRPRPGTGSSDLVLGLGAYHERVPADRLDRGMPVPAQLDDLGHRWQLQRVVRNEPDAGRLRHVLAGGADGRPSLVVAHASWPGLDTRTRVSASVDGRPVGEAGGLGGPFAVGVRLDVGIHDPGDAVVLRVPDRDTTGLRLGLAVYRMAD